MKKIFAFAIAAIMIVAMMAVAVGAQSQAMNGTGWDPDNVVNVKKADPANVIKDGVINANEYERFEVDTSEENSPLHITFITGDDMLAGLDMLATMEYYFSWDEVHGINIAVRNKPAEIQQLLDIKTDGDKPEDDFCQNVAWGVSGPTDNDASPSFYFALGKRTDDGRYLEGHWNQLGAQGNYNPVELQDYIINYDYATGYCTIEWSIPLNVFLTNGGGAGSRLEFTLWANAGTNTVPDFSTAYGVVMGDFGFMVNQKSMINHVTYNITDEQLAGDPTPVPDPDPDPDPNPDNPGGDSGNTPAGPSNDQGQQVVIDPDQYEVRTDDEGNEVIIDRETGEEVDVNTLPVAPAKTGDPMIIMAAVAAVSAAGAFIVRKKRH